MELDEARLYDVALSEEQWNRRSRRAPEAALRTTRSIHDRAQRDRLETLQQSPEAKSELKSIPERRKSLRQKLAICLRRTCWFAGRQPERRTGDAGSAVMHSRLDPDWG